MGLCSHWYELTPARMTSFFAGDRKLSTWDDALDDLVRSEGVLAETDIDKSWFAMHFVLCGTPDPVDGPLGFIMNGDVVDEGEDCPQRVFEPYEVNEIAAALRPVDGEAFRMRFDFNAMKRAGVSRGSEADELEYVGDYYIHLREFVLGVAERGNALVTCIA